MARSTDTIFREYSDRTFSLSYDAGSEDLCSISDKLRTFLLLLLPVFKSEEEWFLEIPISHKSDQESIRPI